MTTGVGGVEFVDGTHFLGSGRTVGLLRALSESVLSKQYPCNALDPIVSELARPRCGVQKEKTMICPGTKVTMTFSSAPSMYSKRRSPTSEGVGMVL